MRIDGAKLAAVLTRLDVTQKELSKLAGLSRNTINGIKAGRKCSDETAKKIADALKIDINEIMEKR